jgi:hypothetical protein
MPVCLLPPPHGGVPGRTLAGRLLVAGFGGLLLLMLVAGVDALLVLRQVRSSDTQERDLYLRRATALDRVRTGIYQAALVMRAYLLATDAREAAFQLEIWKQTRVGTDQALADCAAVLDKATGDFWIMLLRFQRNTGGFRVASI